MLSTSSATGVPGWTPSATPSWSNLSWVERAEGDGCLEWETSYAMDGTISVYSDAIDVTAYRGQNLFVEFDQMGSYEKAPLNIYWYFYGADGNPLTYSVYINCENAMKTTWGKCGTGSVGDSNKFATGPAEAVTA